MADEEINWDSTHTRWKQISDSGWTMTEEFEEENSNDLSAGEWAVLFSTGEIKGRALCSGLSGNNPNHNWGGNSADWTATESQLTSAGDGRYCWCAGTSFGNQCSVSSLSWVYIAHYDNAGRCAAGCAGTCTEILIEESGFRRAVFGVTQ